MWCCAQARLWGVCCSLIRAAQCSSGKVAAVAAAAAAEVEVAATAAAAADGKGSDEPQKSVHSTDGGVSVVGDTGRLGCGQPGSRLCGVLRGCQPEP